MNRFRVFFLSAFLLVLATASFADKPNSPKPDAQRVEIRTDQDNGAVLIVIDDKPMMVVDARGLRVYGTIEHSGTIVGGIAER